MERECKASGSQLPTNPPQQDSVQCPGCGRSVAVDYVEGLDMNVIRQHSELVGGER
jgi:hypothetical protein